MSRSDQVHSGVKWISVAMVSTRGARFLATLVLARLLAPEMFGIIGMAQVSLEIFQKIREMGFGLAYIQRQEKDPAKERIAANTTFWLGCVINITMFIIAFSAAPAVSAFFRTEEAQPVFQALCFAFLITMLSAVPMLTLQKRLKFKKLAICEGIESAAYAIIAIACAFAGMGVWSIVVGQLASRIVFLGCALVASPWRPRLEFSMTMAKELFKFGKYIWAFVILSGIGDALDKLVVGRYYGQEQLGFYTMAFLLSTLPARNITQLVNRLTFPLFSEMQSNLAELREALSKALTHTSMLAMPVSLGLIAVAPEFVDVVLKEKWASIVPLVSVLAVFGMILSVAAVTGPALKAVGKPKVLFYTSIVHHIIKIGLMILLHRYGPLGICYAVLIPLLVSSAIAFVLIARYLEYPWIDLMVSIGRPAIAAVIMMVVVKFTLLVLGLTPLPLAVNLVAGILIGVASYVGSSYLFNREVLLEAAQAIRKMARRGGRAQTTSTG